MELGSVAELVSAGATSGALVAAVVAAVAAYGTNKKQGQQLQRLEQEQEERRQAAEQDAASKVAIWVRVDSNQRPVLRYVNGALPIYAVRIWIATPQDIFLISYSVVGPSQETREMRLGTAELRRQASTLAAAPDWLRLLREDLLLCASVFRDTSNRWWFRNFQGSLSRHADQESAESAARAALRRHFPDAADRPAGR